MKEIFAVSYGHVGYELPHINTEDGFTYYERHENYVVSFTTKYGQEWTHFHRFPLTVDGNHGAKRLAERVQTVLNDKGLDCLDGNHWGVREIYGSQAYSDNEAEIVYREKEDCLMEEAFG